MFCEKCGRKIRPGAGACPECGHEVTATEYCGGFWGINSDKKDERPEEEAAQAGMVPPAEDPVIQAAPPDSEAAPEIRRPQRQAHRQMQRQAQKQKREDHLRLLPYILCGILIIVSFVQLLQIHGMRKTNHKLKREAQEWRREAEAAQEELEEAARQEKESEEETKDNNQKKGKSKEDNSKEDNSKEDQEKQELEEEIDFSESRDEI